MEPEQVHVGQRVKVHLLGAGDHGQIGMVSKVKGRTCYVHLDRDQRIGHVTTLVAQDLECLDAKGLPELGEETDAVGQMPSTTRMP